MSISQESYKMQNVDKDGKQMAQDKAQTQTPLQLARESFQHRWVWVEIDSDPPSKSPLFKLGDQHKTF